jgi:hypothetical protein
LGPPGEMDALADSLPEFVRRVYRHAVDFLGEDEAKALFLTTASKGRGKRGKGRSLAPNRDAFLLREYDLVRKGMAPAAVARLPRILAGLFHRVRPGLYGASAEAIARHIRRLLTVREEQRQSRGAEHPSHTILGGL